MGLSEAVATGWRRLAALGHNAGRLGPTPAGFSVAAIRPTVPISLALGLALAGALAVAAEAPVPAPTAAGSPAPAADPRTRAVDTRQLAGMAALLDAIADRRVVFVGESHDRYEDHLNQLAVIEGLQRRGKDLAIGMEFFQQPYQSALDDFVSGTIDESQMLRRTQYFDRWHFDYRLYRPILRFARDHKIPVIALNLEEELTRRVGDVGIDGLDPAERARLPAEIDRGDKAYRDRLKAAFDQHPAMQSSSFERFLEVQVLWDEGMAERAARYLAEHPGKTLVVLAGSGHVERGEGIPRRLLKRVPVPSAILLSGVDRDLEPELADYLLFPRQVDLPPAGLLGVMLNPDGDAAGAQVQGFSDGSGAKAAGLKEGDRIVRVGAHPVAAYADVRIALVDARPGERIPVQVTRPQPSGEPQTLSFEVELH